MTARRTGPLTLAALAAVTVAALTACGTDHPLAPTAAPVVPVAATGSAGAAATATAGAESGAADVAPAGGPAAARPGGGSGAGGPGSGGGTGTGGSGSGSTSGSTGGGAPSAPAPAIASFRVASQPTCPVHGTPDAPFSSPGTPVTIAWSVTGAGGAAISVDNPGLYGAYGASYPAKGQLGLPFGCNESGTTTHTFTVWPEGAKGTSRTLTVSARSDG